MINYFHKKTFELVMRHKYPSKMLGAILELKPGRMLHPGVKAYNDGNLQLLAAHDNPHAMAKAIKTLVAWGSFTADNIALIAKAVEPELVAQVLAKLPANAIINMDMLAAKNPAAYVSAKTFLQPHPAVAIEIDAILKRHEQPYYLTQVLVKLRKANISFGDYLSKCESFPATHPHVVLKDIQDPALIPH
jgi:hypothetical protein